MSKGAVVVIGSGCSFALAAVAGVLGNELKPGAWWFWLAFVLTLLTGAGVTAWVTAKTGIPDKAPTSGSAIRHGNATVGQVTTKNGPAVGINYGTVNGNPQADRQ